LRLQPVAPDDAGRLLADHRLAAHLLRSVSGDQAMPDGCTMETMKKSSSGYVGALWLAIILALPLAGCGLFNPADPPPPNAGGGTRKPDLQTADSALYC